MSNYSEKLTHPLAPLRRAEPAEYLWQQLFYVPEQRPRRIHFFEDLVINRLPREPEARARVAPEQPASAVDVQIPHPSVLSRSASAS